MKQCYYSYFMDEGRETCWILVALPNLHSQCMDNFVVVHHQCPTLCDPMDCSTPGFPVLYHLPELAQTHIHWGGDAIQPSHPLLSPYPPAFNLSQHQGIFPKSQFFASGGQNMGASASASVLPMNIGRINNRAWIWTKETDSKELCVILSYFASGILLRKKLK